MSTFSRIILTVGSALALAGCAAGLSTDHPYPVYGNPVNPTPVPTYRVECTTVPSATYFLFTDFSTGCRQYLAPATRTEVVVKTRG